MQKLLNATMLLIFFAFNTNAQLFVPVTDADANLSTEEQAKLDLFRSRPEYEYIQMVAVGNLFDVQQNGLLPVQLPGEALMTAQLMRLETSTPDNDPDEFVWEGSFVQTFINENNEEEQAWDGNIELMKKDGEIYGFIHPYNSTDVYELASIAPGKNALIKYSEGAYATENECATIATDGEFDEQVTGPCNTTIKILVVYTQIGKIFMFNNPHNVINQAMAHLNGAVYNSTSHVDAPDFVLAGTYELSSAQFTENPTKTKETLDDLANNPTVQYLRNLHMADIVIALVGIDKSTGQWGRSQIGNGSTDSVYGIVDAFHCNGFYTFSHEVGHIMGGRHQTSDVHQDGADDAGTIEHGYSWYRGWPHNKRYYEVMHKLLTGYPRQHMFSTPDKEIFGRDMGTPAKNNATKELVNNTCTVSEYRDDQIRYFNAKLSGAGTAQTNQTVLITATPINGVASYSFEWYHSTDGGNSYSYITTTSGFFGSTLSYTMPNTPNTIIWVKAISAANEQKVVGKTITNISFMNNGNNCCNFPMKQGGSDDSSGIIYTTQNTPTQFTVHPNPANSNEGITITTPLLPEMMHGNETIIITDMYGRNIHRQPLKGRTTLAINGLNLPAGTYYIQLAGIAQPQTRKLIIIK